jgi:hypothetical protein
MDDLGFVEAVDRLGQSVIVAVADAADRSSLSEIPRPQKQRNDIMP